MDTPLVKRAYNLGLKMVPNLVEVLTEEQVTYYENHLNELQAAIRRGFEIPEIQIVEAAKSPTPPTLTSTGPTFAEWLIAREKLHQFLTGETVILQDMFAIPDDVLIRTDIMPVFRPAGATNRMALDWKVKLGMIASYQEVDVMLYKNAGGSKVPQLHYINRSVKPDANTLGSSAKSPDALLEIIAEGVVWTCLYGWSDADNLHSMITGIHLDSGNTLTLFPDDRLQGDGEVARGYWYVSSSQAKFGWGYRDCCSPYFGARLARPFSLRSLL